MQRLVVFTVLFFSCNCFLRDANPIIKDHKETIVSTEELIRHHYDNGIQKVEQVKEDFTVTRKVSNLTLVGFSWSNCGNPDDDVQLKTLTVSPDPIIIPGTVAVSLDATIQTTIATAGPLILVVKKKIFGVFVEIPCVDNFGSCTYNNPCDFLDKVTCPPELVKLGWTCRCPIPANHYIVPETNFQIPNLPIPSSLENGDYEIQATLMNGSVQLGCYKVDASIKAA